MKTPPSMMGAEWPTKPFTEKNENKIHQANHLATPNWLGKMNLSTKGEDWSNISRL